MNISLKAILIYFWCTLVLTNCGSKKEEISPQNDDEISEHADNSKKSKNSNALWEDLYYVEAPGSNLEGSGHVRGRVLFRITGGLSLVLKKNGSYFIFNDNGFRDVLISRGSFSIENKKIRLGKKMGGELFGLNNEICLDLDAREYSRERNASFDYSGIFCPTER